MKKILVCALEPSANLHLKALLKEFKKDGFSFDLLGIYDERLCQDFDISLPAFSSHEFSAMGFVEVLPLILKAKKAMDVLANFEAHIYLAIDSPAFNLPFAKKLSKKDMKKIYYILPQVWAWKKKRALLVDERFDILASIWPFEKDFYPNSLFVGSPLLDELDLKARKGLEKKEDLYKNIAFLPGSRRAEIKRLMPIYKELARSFSGEKYLCIPSFNKDKIKLYGDISSFTPVYDTKEAFLKADFAFICSGTATLEAALFKLPFILAFKAGNIDFFLAKHFVKLKHIGLANIICDFLNIRAMHPELIQDELKVNVFLDKMKNYDYEYFYKASDEILAYLKYPASQKLAKIIYEL